MKLWYEAGFNNLTKFQGNEGILWDDEEIDEFASWEVDEKTTIMPISQD